MGASKLFEKAKEKDQLSVFRRSEGTLLRDIKDSSFFSCSCFARLLNICKICRF